MPTPPLSREAAQEAMDALREHGDKSAAARALGLPRATFVGRIRKAEEYGLNLSEGARAAVQSARLAPGEADGGWIVEVDPETGSRKSTRWSVKRGDPDPDSLVDALREGLADVPPAANVPAPVAPPELCAVFPVADLHMGLLTDAEEVGVDWDTKKAQAVFQATFGRLVDVTPAAGVAILAQLGDLLHIDDQRNVTPQSGHQLDADTRYFMILRRGVAIMKWAIEALRLKFPQVVYRGTRGNHDITAHYAVTLALAEHYRDTPGVEIIGNASEFYVHEFGRNMLLLHHGDRAKPDRLVHFAAAEWPEVWGRTRHRLALSGHVHHETRKEVGGMFFESVGTIIPRDAHAYSNAYSAGRALVSIVLDRDAGEISRARVAA